MEFRAGKMNLSGTRVVPDTRKGLVRIGRGEEGLTHFQWLDRTHGNVEDDQIVFPDEALLEKVNQSSDRVFILKFHSDSSRKSFFWLQEPSSESDMEICTTVNYYINQPLLFPDEDEVDVSIPLQMSEDTGEDEISSRAGNLEVQNLTSEMASEVTSAGPVQLSDLQRILRNIDTGVPAEEEHADNGLGLGDILKPDLVLPLVETLPLEQRLTCHLPEGPWTLEDLMELLQSPPFRQQVETFSQVIRTGQIDLSQFGINPSKYNFTVLSFLEALEDSVAKSSETGGDNTAGQNDPKSDAMDETR